MDPKKREEFVRRFNRHQSEIFGFFSNQGFDPQDCEELTQETFLAAFKGLEGFRGDADFRTWLFEIARNVRNHSIRSRKALKRAGQEVDLDEAGLDSPRDSRLLWQNTKGEAAAGRQLKDLLSEERLRKTEEAMASLPTQMGRCLFLHVYQGRTYQEIAIVMQISIGTVKFHIHEARKRLKEELGDLFDGFGR